MNVNADVARLGVVGTRHPASAPDWQFALPFPARNMLRRWRSMVGMMIGVGIALGIAMTMFGVGNGSIGIYTSDYLKSSADLYVVTHGGNLVPVLPSDTPGTIKHARNVLSQVRALPGVKATLAVMSWSMERQREGPRRRDEPAELIATTGVLGDPEAIPGSLVLKEGRWLRRSDEVVVGTKLKQEKGLAVGTDARINDRTFHVVGVGKLRGFGFGGDTIAYMDYDAFRERADVGDVVSIIAVDTDRPDEVQQRIEALGSLTAFDRARLVKLAEEVNASGVAFSIILSFLALLIAGIFVASMLNRSVAERRLDFATLRAIGLPTRTIMLTVVAEALSIGLVAGVIGVAISLFFGALINGLMSPAYGLDDLYVADAGLFLLVLALSVGVGIAAGLAPARAATRVDPVEVLREA